MDTNAEIRSFLDHLGDLEYRLDHSTFNYLSVEVDGRRYLLQGRLFFSAFPSTATFTAFSHGKVRAGQLLFSKLEMTAAEVIRHVVDGCLPIEGNLHFPPASRGYEITYQPLHPAGGRTSRLAVLSFDGAARKDIVSQDVLDWEVRGADRPYDHVQELLQDYRLGFTSDRISLEVILSHVVEVDHSSRVQGNRATLGLYLPKELSKDDASLGYRVVEKQQVVSRALLRSGDMSWTDRESHLSGSAEIDVPRGAVVHCVANYQNIAQYSYYATDPDNVPNDRRATYESFDPDLSTLKEWALRTQVKGSNARDMEAAVSWLLWVLGFSPVLLGLFPKTQDAADIVVTTPSGHYAVVECTVGMLRTDNKLPTVVRRANELRQRLHDGGSAHLRVMPVIVTSLPKSSVIAEIEQAERLGVAVATRETLEAAIERTLLPPHPEAIFIETEKQIAEASARHTGKT
ncbi:hypothetical protein ACCT14_32005 [Rhizobium brockwellii]|uniref:hypothetical protein n=1 Tax=Rhizobium brockwellii TaxID=3019932 RepID=UPI003F963757